MRKYLNKASKAIMKSHRVQLPLYDLPIRIRPVRISNQPLGVSLISLVVVPRLHFHRHDYPRLPWTHKLLSFATTE